MGSLSAAHAIPRMGAERADRNFKGPFYILRHVRYRLKRDTGVIERGPGSVGGLTHLFLRERAAIPINHGHVVSKLQMFGDNSMQSPKIVPRALLLIKLREQTGLP